MVAERNQPREQELPLAVEREGVAASPRPRLGSTLGALTCQTQRTSQEHPKTYSPSRSRD